MSAAQFLKIDTPEQIALELPVAGVGSRFLALAVDTLVQVGCFLLASFVSLIALSVMSVGTAGRQQPWSTVGLALLVLFAFCLHWGYFTGFEIAWRGQTPGKRVARIRVIKDLGRPLDAPSAILRNLLRVVDFLPAMYGTGVLVMVLDRQGRRLGDLVAGTVVVHDRSTSGLRAINDDRPPALAAHTPRPELAAITESDVVLIETYLDRRVDLPVDVTTRTAAQIVAHIRARTGAGPLPGE